MDIRTELHNLKRMVLNESHISETSKEKIANRIFEIEKSVAINYTPCCKSDSEQLKVLGEHIAEQFDHKAEDVIEQLEWKFKNL